MYLCPDCNHRFEFPIFVSEEYECYGRPSYQVSACCPHCYGWGFEACDPDEEFDMEENENPIESFNPSLCIQ